MSASLIGRLGSSTFRPSAAAVREYLWAMVRISGNAEWETDPDFALLAVARVVCQYVCYQKLDQGTDPDEHLIGAICELTEALEDFGCRLADGAVQKY